jgi:hypothetical protein
MQTGLAKGPIAPAQLKLKKALPERLRSLGLDEAWLQMQIAQDPSLLGLGELEVVKREKIQSSGGRLDFIMADPDGEIRYEIELMLGSTDESHIIRTIAYWDIERQRYPNLDHQAVIVAEEITSRFFNVIRLLNRAVPIIAIQLSAFRFGDEVVLHPTRVLDTNELGAEPEEDSAGEQVDYAYWQRKASPESLALVERIRELVPGPKEDTRLTLNKHHIALGASGYNFAWFYPRKTISHSHFNVKVGVENRVELLKKLEVAGLEAENHRRDQIRFHLTNKEIQEHTDLITEVLLIAEKFSQR